VLLSCLFLFICHGGCDGIIKKDMLGRFIFKLKICKYFSFMLCTLSWCYKLDLASIVFIILGEPMFYVVVSTSTSNKCLYAFKQWCSCGMEGYIGIVKGPLKNKKCCNRERRKREFQSH
jgi:hypothetical protein